MVLISQFFYFKELSVKVEAETTLNKTLKSLSDANQVFLFFICYVLKQLFCIKESVSF